MTDSLNHLAWVDGIRVYFESNIEQDPCCSWPFYMLARNKIFIPSDMCGEVYATHVQGFQNLINTARSQCWQQIQPDALNVLNMLYRHLQTASPDGFPVYFSLLLLSGFAPLKIGLRRLRGLIRKPPHPAVTNIATLTLKRIRRDFSSIITVDRPRPILACVEAV